jgi:hypothetical protein
VDAPKKKLTPGGVAGALIGVLFSRYAGVNVVVPIVGAIVIAWIIKKVRETPFPMAGAVALQGGHVLWLALAVVVTRATSMMVETVLFAAAVAWLYFKPRLPAVIVLCTYQVVGLTLNVMSFRAVPLDSSDARALSVHIAFRVLSIGAMVVGLRASTRASAAVAPAVTR